MDAARQLPELFETVVELFLRPDQRGPRRLRAAFELVVRERQLERRGHESLLRPVVQVALDPAACLVGRLDEPCARRRELVPRLGVLDRVRHELGERRDPVLGPRRHRLAGGHTAVTAPQTRPPRMIGPPPPERIPSSRISAADHAADLVEVLDPHRSRGLQHPAEDSAAVERAAMPDRHGRRRPSDHPAATTAHSGLSTRSNVARCAPSSIPTSRVTAAKTSACDGALATSVATRRNAACSRTSSSSDPLAVDASTNRL